MHKILILGPQGSGKGTQAELLAKRLSIPALSMGALCRAEAKSGSEQGKEIQAIIDSGNLVSDEVALGLLRARLVHDDARGGYILDGYPRNRAQLLAYDTFDQPTCLLVISVPREESLARLLKRAEIEKRSDDTREVIEQRLLIYEEETLPIIAEYEARGIVKWIDGVGTVEEVTERINLAIL